MRRHLETLERLLAVPAAELDVALTYACDLVTEALGADKVDAFLYDRSRDSLVALGSSNQPLSTLQRQHGLDVLPLSNGGRTVSVYQTGQSFLSGQVRSDPDELRGLKETLAIQSEIGVALEVGGVRRGMIMVASQKLDCWSVEDLQFSEAVARWVGLLAHRAELTEQIGANAVEQGRRAVADELITVMAHDLRNYLAPIDMRLRVVRRRLEQASRADDVRDLDLALKAFGRLSAIIGDLLDVARVDQGVLQIDKQPTALVSLIEEIAAAIATPDHAIDVRAAEELVVFADPRRVRQCIENMLANALKHSPKDASVTVQISRLARERDDAARVEIVDEGPGVDPDMSPRIFDRFVTGQRKEGGLGLGLYLAKRIAVLHGGDLTLLAQPGKGARFLLVLPMYTGGLD
ncbi:MAG TPA: ATP-binding protein [Polyangia bacterium]|nr:ATP-binding protein [Polyangia bacterium]